MRPKYALPRLFWKSGPEDGKCRVREFRNEGAISGDALFAISICMGFFSASQASGNRGPLAAPQNVELEHGAFSGLFDLLDEAVEVWNGLAIQRHDDIGSSEAAFSAGPSGAVRMTSRACG